MKAKRGGDCYNASRMTASRGNSTERFSNRVDNYVRYRPRYPEAVLNILRDEIGLSPTWEIADIGSGTGISAELFLRNGNEVAAVEPNEPMRAAAERLLVKYPRFRSVAGTAEQTMLADHSVDCVVAAQAFHWFDIPRARAQFKRVVRPDGWVVLLWNARRLDATPFLREYEQLLLAYGADYSRVRHDRIDEEALEQLYGNRRFTGRAVENLQPLDFEGLRGRLLSSSYVPAIGEPRHKEMLAALDRLFQKHQRDGHVVIEYDTQIYAGRMT
jgi:SAM-dependent methyltransferase